MNQTKIVIYGCASNAKRLFHYITTEKQGLVVAFVVDDEYKKNRCPDLDNIQGIPVIDYTSMRARFSPSEIQIANSLGYTNMVENRARIHRQCKADGYQMYTFISKEAQVDADCVGEGCIIFPHCYVDYGSQLGEGNFMEIFTLIGHGSIVGNFNFFAGSSMLCGGVRVEDNCFIGARALVIDGGRIEHHALIAGGATVRNAEAESVYFAPRAAKWHGKSSEIKI